MCDECIRCAGIVSNDLVRTVGDRKCSSENGARFHDHCVQAAAAAVAAVAAVATTAETHWASIRSLVVDNRSR